MSIIYQPRGRAAEYCQWAANIFTGCVHGCTYCYAPSATYKTAEAFHATAAPRRDVIALLEKDAIKMQPTRVDGKYTGFGIEALLCFTSDPYQPIEIEQRVTRQAIMVLKMYGHVVRILTKGGMRAVRDFDMLTEHDHFGTTLTCDNDADSVQWEPQAALPEERIDSLRYAHQHGIKTWVSLEPVLYPDQALHLIDLTHDCVDQYKVGKLNYHPRAKEIDWPKFRADAEARLKHYHAAYYLKRDLVEAK